MKFKFLFILLSFSLVFTKTYASFPVAKTTDSQIVNIDKLDQNDTYAAVVSWDEKSQLAALLLCLLIGGLGIHRFYIGYTWQGIVQILTLGGLGIWALIDLIRIITGDLQPKNGAYSKTL